MFIITSRNLTNAALSSAFVNKSAIMQWVLIETIMIFRGTEATDGVDGAVAPEQARAARERESMRCSIVTVQG